jgi:exodeoxyribonuclease V alpha subunit
MENFNGLVLDDSQREAAAKAISNNVSIITGGPGTGKSTTQKIILDVLQRESEETILLLAPTGRAAKRLTEATGQEAFTIHRGLGFDSESFSFQHHSGNPLKASTVIIDEFSMVDNHMAYSLIQALRNNARIIIVGDDQQLPSVSQGQVLADFIQSNAIPTARLNVIHRQAEESGIIKAAHDINHKKVPDDNGKDVLFFETSDDNLIKQKILHLVTEELPRQNYDINEDVMILTPMRKNSLGAWALNDIIKNAINPAIENNPKHSVEFRDKWWSVKDKVMQLRNDYDKEVFNGTIGTVEKIEYDDDEPILVVDFGDIVARYSEKDVNDLDHCWASTVHKVQGSETKVAAILTHTSHSFMLNKNLIYTGATRPKEKCFFIGDKQAFQKGINKTDATQRNTSLCYQIRKYCDMDINYNPEKVIESSNSLKNKSKIKAPKININIPKM